MTPSESNGAYRIERDPLGEKRVPADALYGVQTARALKNFRISRLRMHPLLVTAMAEIKKAAVQTHVASGKLERELGAAIERAADEIIGGQWREAFALDVFQAGAGTSYNMNVNEVIANRALELLGGRRGDYARVNPNDDVNKAQSTNDVMPTAMRITSVRLLRELTRALDALAGSFEAKGKEFSDVEKSGRTHLHDAIPMTLSDEFTAYGLNVRRATDRLQGLEDSLLEVPLTSRRRQTRQGADSGQRPQLAAQVGVSSSAAAPPVALHLARPWPGAEGGARPSRSPAQPRSDTDSEGTRQQKRPPPADTQRRRSVKSRYV